MSDLTDLEICARIAEIAYNDSERYGWDYSDCGTFIVTSESDEFNPLTDKALCFELMVKHGLRVQFKKGRTYAMCYLGFNLIAEVDENPQRAICLAIIAKMENNNG